MITLSLTTVLIAFFSTGLFGAFLGHVLLFGHRTKRVTLHASGPRPGWEQADLALVGFWERHPHHKI